MFVECTEYADDQVPGSIDTGKLKAKPRVMMRLSMQLGSCNIGTFPWLLLRRTNRLSLLLLLVLLLANVYFSHGQLLATAGAYFAQTTF